MRRRGHGTQERRHAAANLSAYAAAPAPPGRQRGAGVAREMTSNAPRFRGASGMERAYAGVVTDSTVDGVASTGRLVEKSSRH